MSAPLYQLLEMNIISAQDLAQVSNPVQAYAVAWVHPDRKLTTQIDQEEGTNPTWNEKFVFRVDDNFLSNENSVITVQVYSSAWPRDVLIGTVGVLVGNILPPNRKPKLRFVALQIRRPSGRPQGILNVGATLLRGTMPGNTMPLYSQLSDPYSEENSLLTMQHCQSEEDSTFTDYTNHGYGYHRQDSEVGVQKGRLFNEERPSPSVVAAAIMKRCYPMPPPPLESSELDGWSESNSNATEGMNKKIRKWRNELSPAYEDCDDERQKLMKPTPRPTPRPTQKRVVGKTPRPGCRPYSCFGTMFGLEISVTVGGGRSRRKRTTAGKGRLSRDSQLTFDDSSV
ncbi:hypothetical protein Fmac_007105 [Flemingia macrophylla]|uniref:C2 domain-containing protein n=1 Tax=Flemingia macrophylla TaxID=520843 RepID=A0ABD1NCH8_9FABA